MKKLLVSLFAISALFACDNERVDPQPQPEPLKIDIAVHEDQLAAFSVTFDIMPEDKDALYYYDIISKARLSEVDVVTIKEEIIEGVNRMAELTGSSYDEVLAQVLSKGDMMDVCSNAGYRPETEFCIYAFYWDDQDNATLSLCEFTTPAIESSAESVEITAAIDVYSMDVTIEPTANVEEYWYYFAERQKAEAMLAGLEDENAYMSYHAMNVGARMEGAQTMEQKGLKPATEYMVLVMGIDNELNRFVNSAVFTTYDEQHQQRVESELFEALLGEWTGVQTITDLYNAPMENTFTVNIMSEIDDIDYDYRGMNQLVATVDGWCNIAYYSATSLIEMEIEDAENKWGPKWVFNIAEGDVVTMDGQVRNSVVGWLFFGDCFMLNMKSDGTEILTNTDFEVEISEDLNTMTIKSPAALGDTYPGLGYYFEGLWMGFYYGCSDIVLTRNL